MKTHYRSAKIACRGKFTLVEVIISVAIVLLLVGITVNFLLYLTHQWTYLNLAADMRAQGARAVELFKGDLSFSSPKEIVLYPSEDAALGMSFPILSRTDHSTPPMTGDEINWTHTVIYHLFSDGDGKKSIRRTIFSNRDNGLTDAQRLAQLRSVIDVGDASTATNGQYARTNTVVEDVFSFSLSKGCDLVDARDSGPDRPRMVHLGVARISPGKHTFRFETADELDARQNIGIDALYLLPSGSQVEGESFVSSATVNGGSVAVDLPVASHNWENESQMLFSAVNPKAYVEFDLYNDMWMESEFAQPGAQTDRTRVTTDSGNGQVVLALVGNDVGWEVGYQAGGDVVQSTGYTATCFVRLVLKGTPDAAIGLAGERMKIRLTGTGLKNAIKIGAAGIMERVSGPNGDYSTFQPVTFKGGSQDVVFGPGAVDMEVESDWVELAYDPAKDYLLTLKLENVSTADAIACPAMFDGQIGAYRINVDPNVGNWTDWLEAGTTLVRYPDWDRWNSFSFVPEQFKYKPLAEELQMTLPDGTTTTDTSYPFPLVADIFVSYPASGTYTSRIYDTKISSVTYASLYGTVSGSTFGGDVKIKVRTSSDATMVGATDWGDITALTPSTAGTSLGGVGSGRYVQFQAELRTPSPYLQTPHLFETYITWDGPDKIVDLGGKFTFGGDYGKFRVYMDGEMLNTVNANMDFKLSRSIRGEEILRTYHVSTSSHQILQEE